jgi:hypothetical protein
MSSLLRIAASLITASCVSLLFATETAAQQEQESDEVDARVLAYDKGPQKIDVSKYPKDMQARYRLFMTKCGKCHTPARAINSEFVLEDEWERYVKRMMRKAGSFITSDDGKEIYEFVVYDSRIRKKDLYDRRSKEAVR